MINEMNKENYTLEKMAEICDISYKQLCNILYGKSSDIYFSTFEKICINNAIPYDLIFEFTTDMQERKIEMMLSKFVITNGTTEYRLHRIENTPPRNN